jgi:ABC-type branched-subunit amino acid transport system substrate-binding protein
VLAAGEYSEVNIGEIPAQPSGDISSWQTNAIQWPGQGALPVDGVATMQIDAAVLLGFTKSDGSQNAQEQMLFCAAKLAEAHINSHDGSVAPVVANLSSRTRLALLPYDTKHSVDTGLAAFDAALTAGAAAVIGASHSSVSIPIAARAAGLPQISPLSSLYPGFARTIPSDTQLATALVETIRNNFFSWAQVGVLYVEDEYGRSFLKVGARTFLRGQLRHF